jgi:gliding motility-associated-like protein
MKLLRNVFLISAILVSLLPGLMAQTVATHVSGTGGLNNLSGIDFDGSGNLYVGYSVNSTVNKIAIAGGVGTGSSFVNSGLGFPDSHSFDVSGNLHVANETYNTISKVTLSPAVVYVTPGGGSTTKDGTSWANALDSIAFPAALAAAGSGTQFWVAAGTYRPTTTTDRTQTFTLPSGVQIYGGFAGTETLLSQRNYKTNLTVLSGDIGTRGISTDNSYIIVTITNAANTTQIDGFTISGAYNSGGGGGGGNGGGIYNSVSNASNSSKPVIANCNITNCFAQSGGGLSNIGNLGNNSGNIALCSPAITNCIFSNDSCSNGFGGGAVLNSYATASFTNCVFSSNSSNNVAGGVDDENSNCVYTNCVFANNRALPSGYGGAMRLANSVSSVINCTFYNNSCYQNNGGAIRVAAAGTLNASNCIFYNNNLSSSAVSGADISSSATANVTNCITQLFGTNGVNGNKVGVNPNFVSTTNLIGPDNIWGTADDGLQLTSGSPAVDAATATGAPSTDITGASRPQGAGYDMGAYELSAAPVISITANLTSFTACAGSSSSVQSFTVSGSNLTGNIAVTAPTGFELASVSSGAYSQSLTLTATGGAIAITSVYIRVAATAPTGAISGNITCTSAGATAQTIALSGTVNTLPTISLGTVSNITTSATAFNLPYSTTTGSPNQYSINTVGTVIMSGFAAISNATLGASPISVLIPASAANTYNFSLTVTNSITGCVSNSNAFTVTVNIPPPPAISIGGTFTPLVSTFATGLNAPDGIAFDAAGNLYSSNYLKNTISKITSGGTVSTFATGLNAPFGIAFDAAGNLYVSNWSNNTISKITIVGGVNTGVSTFVNAGLSTPSGIAFDGSGNLYVGNKYVGIINKITNGGSVSTFVSSGLNSPFGLAFDGSGNLYVSNSFTNIIDKITNGGSVSTFVSSGLSAPFGLAFDGSGNLYVANSGTNTISKITNGGVSTFVSSGLNGPSSIAFDVSGNLYVANTGNNTISKIAQSLSFSTCSGTSSAPQLFTVSGNNLISGISVTAPTGFELSTVSGGAYSQSLSLTASGGTNAISSVYVRIAATATPGALSGTITCSSAGATAQIIAITGMVNALPTISLGAVAGIITNAVSFSLPYSGKTGSPNQYSINTAGTVAMSGFTAITNAPLGASPIRVPIPASVVNTYNFSLTVKNSITGCVSNSNTFTVTVNPPPPVTTITGTLSSFKTCSGIASTPQSFNVSGNNLISNITITAPTGFELAATSGGAYSNSISVTQNNGTVSSTPLFIRLSSSAGNNTGGSILCTATNAVTQSLTIINSSITINPLPATPVITPVTALAFCSGQSVVLASSAATGNQWYLNGTLINAATINQYTAINGGSYTVVVTNSTTACVSATSLTATVVVNSNPVATIAQGSQLAFSNCASTSISLSANAGSGYSYQWSNSNGIIQGATAQQYTVTQAGNYSVRIKDVNSCNAVSGITKILAIPSTTASGSTAVCSGATVSLSASAGNFNNPAYQWLSNGTVISGANSATFNAGTTGSYSVQIVSGGLGSVSCPISVTVNALPVVTVSATPGNSVCAGTPLSVNASVTGIVSYQWLTNGNALSNATGSSLSIAQGGSYSVQVTDGNGCITTSSPATLTINALPTLSAITGTPLVTVNSTTNLLSTPSGGSWSSNNTAVATVDGNGVVTGIATGTATISYSLTNTSNCSAMVTTLVTVNTSTPKPTITAGSATSFCSGGSVVLTSGAASGNQWYQNGTIIGGATASSFTATASGAYTVVVGGVSSDVVQVTVNTNPDATIQQGSQLAFSNCANTSITLTAANTTPGINYQWGNSSGDILNATNQQYTVTQADNFTLRVTDINNCTSTSGVTKVIGLPTASAAGNTSACSGTMVSLSVDSSVFISPSYQWQLGGTNISGATNASYNPTVTGSYTIMVTDGGNSSVSCAISVTINPLPIVTISPSASTTCAGSAINLTATANLATYQWLNNGNAISNATASSYSTNINGQYSAQVTDNNGCGNTSNVSVVAISALPVVGPIAGSSILCVNSTALLVNTTDGGTWSTSNPAVATVDVTGLVTGVGPGTATISYAVSSANCAPVIATMNITVNATTAIVTQPVSTIAQCAGTATGISVAATGTALSYQWYQNGNAINGATGSSYTNNSLAVTDAGNYTVVVTGTCGNTISNASVWTVNALPIVAPVTGTQQVCVGSTTSLSSNTPGGVWSSSNAAIANISPAGSSAVITGIAPGTTAISYSVTSGSGCTTTVTNTVTVNALPAVPAITGNTGICIGAIVQLANNLAGGVWASSNSTVATISGGGLVTSVSAGTATVSYVVTNAVGCSNGVSATITVNALPTVTASATPATVAKGQTVQLQATVTGTIASYNWSPADNLSFATTANPVARVLANTIYTVIVSTIQGCSASASVNVTATDEIFVAPTNIFTPNGDGVNDKFVIKNLDIYPNNRLQVFDRTGKIIYDKNNYANDWDGRVGGKILTKDTYFYVLTVNGQVVKKGAITVVR